MATSIDVATEVVTLTEEAEESAMRSGLVMETVMRRDTTVDMATPFGTMMEMATSIGSTTGQVMLIDMVMETVMPIDRGMATATLITMARGLAMLTEMATDMAMPSGMDLERVTPFEMGAERALLSELATGGGTQFETEVDKAMPSRATAKLTGEAQVRARRTLDLIEFDSEFKVKKKDITMFRVLNIQIKAANDRAGLAVEITFTCPSEDLIHFRHLQNYYEVQVVNDIDAYEKYYDDPLDKFVEFVPIENSELSRVNFLRKSPFELGLISNQFAKGEDALTEVEGEKDTYKYSDFVCDCPITRACIAQITEIQSKMSSSDSNDPQVDSFGSGSAVNDFANIIQTLFLFWD